MESVKTRPPYMRDTMFSTSFSTGSKKDHGIDSEARVYRVLNAKELLVGEEAQGVLDQIKTLAVCPAKHYQSLYGDLINNFVEYCQVIPTFYGGRLSSLFNDSLKQALVGLEIIQEREKSLQEPANPLLAYAVFTVALLRNLAHLLTDKRIFICNDQGHFIKEWQPFAGSLVKLAKYYKIRSYSGDLTPSLGSVTTLLARQLMPAAGFLWLMDDPIILNLWLRCFMPGQGDEEEEGGLQTILALIIERIAHRGIQQLEGALLISLPVEYTEPTEMAAAEAFLAWIKKGLAENTLSINQENSGVQMTGEGLYLLYSVLGEEFARQNPDVGVLVQGMQNYLGVFPLSGADLKAQKKFAMTETGKRTFGQLFAKSALQAGQTNSSLSSKQLAERGYQGPVDSRYFLSKPNIAMVQAYLASQKPSASIERLERIEAPINIQEVSVTKTAAKNQETRSDYSPKSK
jgi:hypothetical protein